MDFDNECYHSESEFLDRSALGKTVPVVSSMARRLYSF